MKRWVVFVLFGFWSSSFAPLGNINNQRTMQYSDVEVDRPDQGYCIGNQLGNI